MSDSLKEHGDKVTFKVLSKKHIGIYFQNLEETKNAEEALLEVLKGRAKVTRIYPGKKHYKITLKIFSVSDPESHKRSNCYKTA